MRTVKMYFHKKNVCCSKKTKKNESVSGKKAYTFSQGTLSIQRQSLKRKHEISRSRKNVTKLRCLETKVLHFPFRNIKYYSD
jgi:hypothetical protein